MSELGSYKKADLKELAKEFGADITDSDRIMDIIQKIEGVPGYNKTLAISQIKHIVEDRKSNEAEIKERAKEEKEERDRMFELEKLKLTQAGEIESVASTRAEKRSSVSLKSVMQKFDPEKSDMALFLTLFVRQAKKLNLEDDEMVTQLLTLLPVEIAELILREPEEKLDDFEYVKSKLLHRFKLSPETYRTKFVQQQRKSGSLWKDLVFELRSYLDGWLEGLQITSFEELKRLMITDQVKRRASPEMKDSLIDSWSKFVDPDMLAAKLDEHEMARKQFRKNPAPKSPEEKRFEESREIERNKIVKKPFENTKINWRNKNTPENLEREKIFEKRKSLVCFHCSSPDHFKYNCPELKKDQVERLNNLRTLEEFPPSFAPYLSTARVNEIETTILHDTGSSTDLVPRKLVKPDQFSGEVIWLKQPLENKFRCLPVANVEIEFQEVGVIKAKAAVVDSEVVMNHYLLGNRTQQLINKKVKQPQLVSAMTTPRKSQTAEAVHPFLEKNITQDTTNEPLKSAGESPEEKFEIVSPPPQQSLVDISEVSIVRPAQTKDKVLEMFRGATSERKSGMLVEDDLCVRKKRDNVCSFDSNGIKGTGKLGNPDSYRQREKVRAKEKVPVKLLPQVTGVLSKEMRNGCLDENFVSKMKVDSPYPTADPGGNDCKEIARDNKLKDKGTPEPIHNLEELLIKHRRIFSNEPGEIYLIEPDIDLNTNQPVRIKSYRTSPRQTENLKREIKRMLDLKIIEEGESNDTVVHRPGGDIGHADCLSRIE